MLTLAPDVDFDLDFVNARIRDGTCTVRSLGIHQGQRGRNWRWGPPGNIAGLEEVLLRLGVKW